SLPKSSIHRPVRSRPCRLHPVLRSVRSPSAPTYRLRSCGHPVIAIEEVLAAGGIRAWPRLGGRRSPHPFHQYPPVLGLRDIGHGHETHDLVSSPGENDLITGFGPLYQFGQLAFRIAHGHAHLAYSCIEIAYSVAQRWSITWSKSMARPRAMRARGRPGRV